MYTMKTQRCHQTQCAQYQSSTVGFPSCACFGYRGTWWALDCQWVNWCGVQHQLKSDIADAMWHLAQWWEGPQTRYCEAVYLPFMGLKICEFHLLFKTYLVGGGLQKRATWHHSQVLCSYRRSPRVFSCPALIGHYHAHSPRQGISTNLDKPCTSTHSCSLC